MQDVANHLDFGYFTAALLATAAVAFGAGIQFLVIGVRQRRDPTHLAFAVLCLCIATLAFSNAVMDAADSPALAILALRILCAAAVLALPALVLFVGGYTGRPVDRYLLGTVCALALCHVPDLAPVFAEFARVLRPGGHLVISDPHVLLSYLRPTLPRTPGPDGRPTTFTEYHWQLSDYLAAALPVGFQVRHCAEPRIRTKQSTTAGVPTVIPGSSAPQLGWELLDWVPEAVTAAMNVPSIVIWHFQLADAPA